MELTHALVIYILLIIATYIIARYCRVRFFSAVTLSVMVGIIILSVIYPYPQAGRDMYRNGTINNFSSEMIVYGLIQVLTWVIIFWYICQKIMFDVEDITCVCVRQKKIKT
jgi:hypothetical protein